MSETIKQDQSDSEVLQTVYTQIPKNLKESVKQKANQDGQSVSRVMQTLLSDGLDAEKLKKIVDELQTKIKSMEEKEESEPKKNVKTGFIPSKSIDLSNHKAMLEAGLSYCPTCAMDLRTGKDLKVLLSENSEKVVAELHKKAAENFTANLRKLWNERKNLTTECYACGFPVKTRDRDDFSMLPEDVTCPICGGTKGKKREDGVGYDESTWVIKP